MTEDITAGEIAVRIPNAGKVLFPDDGITKEDLAGITRMSPPGLARRWPRR